jgi:zinc transporter ZupT
MSTLRNIIEHTIGFLVMAVLCFMFAYAFFYDTL